MMELQARELVNEAARQKGLPVAASSFLNVRNQKRKPG